MSESDSALTFLGNKNVRESLANLWKALNENDMMSTALITELNAWIKWWETPGSNQAEPITSSEPAYAIGNTSGSGQTVSMPDKTLLNADCLNRDSCISVLRPTTP